MTPAIHVVAGVLRDDAGRVLLAQRGPGDALAGLWEFPGGKREHDETSVAALRRELDEELGIQVRRSRPLIAVPFDYPDKHIVLDVHQIDEFSGQPSGREGQLLRWVEPDALAALPMPPADWPVRAALQQPALLAITPEPGADHALFMARILRLAERGLQRVQLRCRSLDQSRQRQLAQALVAPLRARGCELLLNGDSDGALALGCGLHLRAAQLAEWRERPLPSDRLLTASCHSLDEIRASERLQVDAILLGPVQPTASHPGQPALGWAHFARLRAATALPIYALGGLGPADLDIARNHGAQGIAAIRQLWATACENEHP